MNITELPSGSYRIREMVDGKLYSITTKRRPTDKIARRLLDEIVVKKSTGGRTFKAAAETYIEAKYNILSPATIRGYNSMLRNIPESFLCADCANIDTLLVQQTINEYSRTHSAKSTHNLNGFILSVLRLFNPDINIHTTLPQIPRKNVYTPSQDDVKRLLEASIDTEYYACLYLASLSLRLSEICALDLSDLDGNKLTVNKAYIRGEKGYTLKETPKTDASNRTIILPDNLVKWITEHGYIYRLYPNQAEKYLHRVLPQLGIPFFSIHKLRHFFASYAHDMGYSDAVIQSVGGWSSDYVMKKIYRHAMAENEAVKSISSDFTF